MSIPLVQNNEKDSINTSIIAIKRQIERINMLLGLSNSEEIDTSKFATKDELQQAVTDLQPVNEVAVDNMHSVTSNAVAGSLSYSTTEQKTGGVWIDGKPIYRKVFTANNAPSNDYVGTITNIDTPIRFEVFARNNADNAWLPRSYGVYPNTNSGNPQARIDANGNIYFHVEYYTLNKVIIIIEYTKTTD